MGLQPRGYLSYLPARAACKWSAWVSTEEQLCLGAPCCSLEPFLGMAVLRGGREVRQEVSKPPVGACRACAWSKRNPQTEGPICARAAACLTLFPWPLSAARDRTLQVELEGVQELRGQLEEALGRSLERLSRLETQGAIGGGEQERVRVLPQHAF